jgi:hypothetical protein
MFWIAVGKVISLKEFITQEFLDADFRRSSLTIRTITLAPRRWLLKMAWNLQIGFNLGMGLRF